MKQICAAVLVAMLGACAAPPVIDRNTRYEGNVSPLEYKHVTGAPIRRNATAEMAGAVAGGVGYAAGGAAVGAPINTSQATQAGVQAAQAAAARNAAPGATGCTPRAAGGQP
jgi:hypothetical protein